MDLPPRPRRSSALRQCALALRVFAARYAAFGPVSAYLDFSLRYKMTVFIALQPCHSRCDFTSRSPDHRRRTSTLFTPPSSSYSRSRVSLECVSVFPSYIPEEAHTGTSPTDLTSRWTPRSPSRPPLRARAASLRRTNRTTGPLCCTLSIRTGVTCGYVLASSLFSLSPAYEATIRLS